jgi:hypothetical protein
MFEDSHQYRCKVTGKNGKSHEVKLTTDRALSASEIIESIASTAPKGTLASLEVLETLLPEPTPAELRADALAFEDFIQGFSVQLFTRA